MTTTLLLTGTLLLRSFTDPTTTDPPASGRITYEVMQKIDPSQMRIVINGQEVKPGSVEAPPDMPDVRTFTQSLAFAGRYGKEERDESEGNMVRRILQGPGGGGEARPVNLGRPFDRKVYLDLTSSKMVEVLEIKKDAETSQYQTEMAVQRVQGWQQTDKTRKIAGYSCRKATVNWKNVPYSIWITTELPFTYSPIGSLTPEKGVVLLIESETESFKATKVEAQPIPESEVMPPKTARLVSSEELESIRKKAQADFRQKMISRPFPD